MMSREDTLMALRWTCVSFAVWFTLAFLFIAGSTLTYPFHLEWMEGQVIDIVQRVRDGLPVYAEPSLDYVSFAYTPFYYYAVAAVSFLTGVDFFPARLLSMCSAIGVGVLIYKWVRKEGGQVLHAVIAAGLFFATYKLSGRWFDNSRVDSLFLLLTTAGLYVFYQHRGMLPAVATAVLLSFAFMTKQSSLIAAFPTFFAALLTPVRRKDAVTVLVVWAVLVFVACQAFNSATDGWFNFFAFELESGHGIQKQYLRGFWFDDLFSHVGILFAIAAFLVGIWWAEDRQKFMQNGALLGGYILCSYFSRLNWGGYLNVLMPAHAVLALFSGLTLAEVENKKQAFAPLLIWMIAFQMLMVWYKPMPLIPSDEQREKGERFLATIGQLKGDVFMPELQWVETRVGKKSYTLGMAAFDLLNTDLKEKNVIKEKFRRQVHQAVIEKRFGAIVPGKLVQTPEMNQYYQFQQGVEYPKEFVTGATNFLPSGIFVRISDAEPVKDTP